VASWLQDVERKLIEAEDNIKIAEAEIARGFDCQRCHRHFPPGGMLEIGPFKSCAISVAMLRTMIPKMFESHGNS
jgi:hypothetical protein